MFGLYFGRYLFEKGIAAKEEIDDIPDLPYPVCIDKLIEKGRFSREEAEKHFLGFKGEYGLGDEAINAIDSGDMERIASAFLRFDDAGAMEANLKAYQKENGFTDVEMEALWKNGGILRIIPDYIHSDPMIYNRFVKLTLECVVRFVEGALILKKARQTRDCDVACLACQELKGAHRVFLGISGEGSNLKAFAEKYAGKEFPEMNDKAYDSVCELINTINGLFASALSKENIRLEIAVPHHYERKTLRSAGLIYRLPAVVGDAEIEFVFSFDNSVNII